MKAEDMKFRYRIYHKESHAFGETFPDKIVTHFFTLKDIENCKATGYLESCILSRDRWTGLKDKNGKEIWENDEIVSRYWENRLDKYVSRRAIVTWNETHAYFGIIGTDSKHWCPALSNVIGKDWTVKVVGTVYDKEEK